MAGVVAIILGLLVMGALVYGAIAQFKRRQAVLNERAVERERSGEAAHQRRLHAEREARAHDDD